MFLSKMFSIFFKLCKVNFWRQEPSTDKQKIRPMNLSAKFDYFSDSDEDDNWAGVDVRILKIFSLIKVGEEMVIFNSKFHAKNWSRHWFLRKKFAENWSKSPTFFTVFCQFSAEKMTNFHMIMSCIN
jgi:hypothetical protein